MIFPGVFSANAMLDRRSKARWGCGTSCIFSQQTFGKRKRMQIASQFLLLLASLFISNQTTTMASEEAAPTGARGGLFGAGGRFKGGTDPIMEKFNESLSFDKR